MSTVMQELADVQVARHKWTVSEYDRLIEAGIIDEDERIELIQGEVVEMAPISSGHSGHVKCLVRLLSRKLGERLLIGVQDPITLDDESEPQPDFSIVRPRDDDYTDSHPAPADVYFLIEVAETSVEYDRKAKAKLYARAMIPEFWLVNLRDRQIQLFREPSPDGYLSQKILDGKGELHPLAFPDVTILVSEILRSA